MGDRREEGDQREEEEGQGHLPGNWQLHGEDRKGQTAGHVRTKQRRLDPSWPKEVHLLELCLGLNAGA